MFVATAAYQLMTEYSHSALTADGQLVKLSDG